MPFAHHDGIDLYFERHGSGPRLLYINGSGSTIEGSRALIGLFAGPFDLVVFDHRGLGQSTSTGPYTMADCAADALCVMDAVGWDTARVLGISFGGMVAQELAVTVPERVERLALLCTSSGGAGGSSYPLHTLDGLAPAERAVAGRRLLDTRFDADWLSTHPEDRRLAEAMDGRWGAAEAGRRTAELDQLEARRHHDVWDRLDRVACPTFVGSGRYDGIAPPANGDALASRIAGAEFHEYEGGHAFFAQDPSSVPEVTGFLAGTAPGDGRAG